ncbi:YitT family protein [Thermosyntropha lipolytica]|nr:YitT family protein [Thermosyntropha lipolytica]
MPIKKGISSWGEQVSWKDIIGIIAGSIIVVIAIQSILIPAKVLTGGVTGIAIVLQFITGIDVWVWFILLNIPIFLAGYKFVSRRFVFYSLFATLLQTVLLGIMPPIDLNLDNLLLAAIFGGALNGLGSGIILRYKASSGGMDIIAVIVKRIWGYSIGQTFFIGNLVVLALSLAVFNLELALFSAISIYVFSKTLDAVEAGPNVTRTAMIISEQAEAIAYAIMNDLGRGCTYIPAEGAYSGRQRKIILVTVGKTQLPRLKEIVFQIDSEAFIIINETIEAFGKGFSPSNVDF